MRKANSQGIDDFFEYIDNFGFTAHEIILVSSLNHYFYDEMVDEMLRGKSYRNMSHELVRKILKKPGFKLVKVKTERNLTYFSAHKVNLSKYVLLS
jgi:hypothetical protein